MDPLLERERELTALTGALGEAQEGRGRLVVVEAPAGLGKTSLLGAAFEAAGEAGFTCLRARASDLERDFAYGCVRQLLDPLLARVSDDERERMFAGAAALSKCLFAPTGEPATSASPDSAFSMLHGLYWLINNIADEGPVALCVDDLHWTDSESLRFLNFLAPRLDGLAVAILATARPGARDAGELARLTVAPETTLLRPEPLSAEATSALCRRRLGPEVAPEFTAACRDATGGNPFLLEALLREAAEQDFATDAAGAERVQCIGPAAVAQAVVLRLSGKPPTATALVRAISVLGDGASLTEAAELAELSVAEAARATDLLVELAILGPGDGLEFAHSIVREAIYADIGSRERARAHARAAQVLSASSASDERIAAQIVQAEPGGNPARVEFLRRVAADALGRGAPSAAAAWLRRALAEPPPAEIRGEVLLELSSAELRLGTPEAAIDRLTAAAELVPSSELVSASVRLLAGALTWSGDADRAVLAIDHAIEMLGESDRELALLLEAERAAYAQQGSLETRAPVAERLEQFSDLRGDTAGERLVLASLAFERARGSESASEAAAYIEQALAGTRLQGEQEVDVAGTLYLLVLGLLSTDALDIGAGCLEGMLADAEDRASIPAQAFVIVHRGWFFFRQGAVGDAEADARTALELLTTYDIPLGTRFALGLLVTALIEGDQVEAAERELRKSGYGDHIPAGMASNALLEARAHLHVAQGRTSEGVEDLVQFGTHDELWGAANPLGSRWRSSAALALASMGENERAAELAADDLARAHRWGAASGVGVALRAVGLVEGGDAGIERLREAVDVLADSPARLEHARALTDLGAALRRGNRRAAARRALHDGLRQAEHLGARALAKRARTELRAAGGRSGDPSGNGVQQLTASEHRVAELAAKGMSNPEIAQTLFVTRKTIETHLGQVYRKLDISGRGKLVHALAGSNQDQGP